MNRPDSPTLRALHSLALRTIYDVAHIEQYDGVTDADLVRSTRDTLEQIATGEYQRREDIIARICDDADLESTYEYKRLTEAAPDLLAACKACLDAGLVPDLDSLPNTPTAAGTASHLIRAAIAKAEGGAA